MLSFETEENGIGSNQSFPSILESMNVLLILLSVFAIFGLGLFKCFVFYLFLYSIVSLLFIKYFWIKFAFIGSL